MKKSFVPLAVVTALLFVIAPILIARAPYESEMLLIQKIFYFHVPSWVAMYCGLLVCAVGSIWYLFKGNRVADRYAESAAELVLLLMVRVHLAVHQDALDELYLAQED